MSVVDEKRFFLKLKGLFEGAGWKCGQLKKTWGEALSFRKNNASVRLHLRTYDTWPLRDNGARVRVEIYAKTTLGGYKIAYTRYSNRDNRTLVACRKPPQTPDEFLCCAERYAAADLAESPAKKSVFVVPAMRKFAGSENLIYKIKDNILVVNVRIVKVTFKGMSSINKETGYLEDPITPEAAVYFRLEVVLKTKDYSITRHIITDGSGYMPLRMVFHRSKNKSLPKIRPSATWRLRRADQFLITKLLERLEV